MTPHLPVQVPGFRDDDDDDLPAGVSWRTKDRRRELLRFKRSQAWFQVIMTVVAAGSLLAIGNWNIILPGFLVSTWMLTMGRGKINRDLDKLEQKAIEEVMEHHLHPKMVISNATITQGPDGALVATNRIDGSRTVITGDSVLRGEVTVSVHQIRPS